MHLAHVSEPGCPWWAESVLPQRMTPTSYLIRCQPFFSTLGEPVSAIFEGQQKIELPLLRRDSYFDVMCHFYVRQCKKLPSKKLQCRFTHPPPNNE